MTEADIFFLVATVQYGDPPVQIPGTDVRVYKGRITNALKWDTPTTSRPWLAAAGITR